MTAHHLVTTSYAETWAIEPRPELPFPLVLELVSSPMTQPTLERLGRWVNEYAKRGPPWQDVVDADLDPARLSLVLERFVGISLADVLRNLSAERWVLPPATWLAAAEGLFDAFTRGGEHLLREPPSPSGIGWSLRGDLVLAPLALNALLASGPDVGDHTVLFSPEHVLGRPLTERSLVFELAVCLAWLLTGWHPLEAETGGHVGGLLRAERPLAAGWKLGSPPDLTGVLDQAMAHDAAARFASLSEFRRAVRSALPVRPSSKLETFSTLQAATHRLVDRLVEHLWTKDTLLPATWDGLWPDGIHPLEGLSVVEDRLLEHRVDKRTFLRRADVGPSLRPWRTPPERVEDDAAFRRADADRWWVGAPVLPR